MAGLPWPPRVLRQCLIAPILIALLLHVEIQRPLTLCKLDVGVGQARAYHVPHATLLMTVFR
jgi:hypothetical protein